MLNNGELTDLTIGKRRVLKIGGSMLITLPPEFVDHNQIQPGDELTIYACKNVVKIIYGNNNEEEENQLQGVVLPE